MQSFPRVIDRLSEPVQRLDTALDLGERVQLSFQLVAHIELILNPPLDPSDAPVEAPPSTPRLIASNTFVFARFTTDEPIALRKFRT